MINSKFSEALIILIAVILNNCSEDSELKNSLLRISKWLGAIFLILIILIAVGLPIINSTLLTRTRSEAEAGGYMEHTSITGENLEGSLDLECDKRNGLSWLYYDFNGTNKLVWQDSQAYAKVSVAICGKNKISIFYDFDQNDSRKDSMIILNLEKGETFHTNYWKSFFQVVGK